ncbi:MAG: hypothetical protein JO368_05275 [Acidimicrobiales bacterium]|nr:hypothetical protein [Acidimicrobiales bacterium]
MSDSFGTHTGKFRLSIQRLDVGVGCKSLKFGKAASAHIKEAASATCFTFTAASGDALFAKSVGTSGTIGTPSAIVTSAAGAVECLVNGTVECPLSAAGSTTVVLYSESGSGTGSFRIYPQQMTAPQHCTAVMVGGPGKSGSVAKAGDVACFAFSGTSGDTDTATITGLTGSLSPEIDFFRPTGTSACASSGLTVSCPLDATGSWTILVYDVAGPGTGSFSLAVTKT